MAECLRPTLLLAVAVCVLAVWLGQGDNGDGLVQQLMNDLQWVGEYAGWSELQVSCRSNMCQRLCIGSVPALQIRGCQQLPSLPFLPVPL